MHLFIVLSVFIRKIRVKWLLAHPVCGPHKRMSLC